MVLVHVGGYSNHPQDLGGHRGKNDLAYAGWHLLTSKPILDHPVTYATWITSSDIKSRKELSSSRSAISPSSVM